MKDHELDKLLLSYQLPEMPEEYWAEFPKRVLAKLRDKSAQPPRAPPPQRWIAKLLGAGKSP